MKGVSLLENSIHIPSKNSDKNSSKGAESASNPTSQVKESENINSSKAPKETESQIDKESKKNLSIKDPKETSSQAEKQSKKSSIPPNPKETENHLEKDSKKNVNNMNNSKDQDEKSEIVMKESLLNQTISLINEINREEQERENFINNENNNENQNNNLENSQFNSKEKNIIKSAQDDHEANTKEELEKKRKKLLMTEVSNAFDTKDFFTFHDLIVPGGKNASLCLVNEPFNKNLRVSDIADHFKFIEPQQVIVLIGANTKRKIKLFAGISRAALNTRAIIIDSGLQTGIEKFCLRKNITLIGIAPENKIEYPKINPEEFSNTLLTNGHTHFILLGKDDKTLNWGQEAKFKINFVERLINGRKGAYQYKAKVVGIILGNIPNCVDECLMFIEKKWPLILIEDSDFSQFIKDSRDAANDDDSNKYGDKIALIGKYSKLIEIDDDSENLAASIHICLTLSF